jgi:ParB family chromosome partitioning protein
MTASRPVGEGYEIVAGERRYRAVKLLGWIHIPAIVRELSDEAASAIMLAENTGRADLNPIEEANAYQRRVTTFGWSAERIADVAGVSKDRVTRPWSSKAGKVSASSSLATSSSHYPKKSAYILRMAEAAEKAVAAKQWAAKYLADAREEGSRCWTVIS